MNTEQINNFSYLQRQNLLQKKVNKPIIGMHHIKSEQQFPVQNDLKAVSRSFLSNSQQQQNGSGQHTQQRLVSTSHVAQNLAPVFYAQSESKTTVQPQRSGTPRQPHQSNNLTAQITNFSSCQRERPSDLESQQTEARQFSSVSIMGSPPPQNQRQKQIISQNIQQYIQNSSLKAKTLQNNCQIQSQKEETSQIYQNKKNSLEEQFLQLKQDVQILLTGKQEVSDLKDRLVQAEKYIQQIFQSGILNSQEQTNRVRQDQLIEFLQKKFQELELQQDQMDFYQREFKAVYKEHIKEQEEQITQMKRLLEDTKNTFTNSLTELNQKNLEFLKDFNDFQRQFNEFKPTVLLQKEAEQIIQKIIQEVNQNDVTATPSDIPLCDQINKFEQFNREINNYLTNRRIPQQLDQFQKCVSMQQSHSQEEIEQAGLLNSLNQSDVETIDNYDLSESILKKRSPLSTIDQKQDIRFMKQNNNNNNNDCKQFDIYDHSKHQMLSKSVEMTLEQKIKSLYRCQMSAISENQMEESCVESNNFDYDRQQRISTQNINTFIELVDEQGYLIDERGQFLRDSEGNQIKLSNSQLQWLKEREMLEEVQ